MKKLVLGFSLITLSALFMSAAPSQAYTFRAYAANYYGAPEAWGKGEANGAFEAQMAATRDCEAKNGQGGCQPVAVFDIAAWPYTVLVRMPDQQGLRDIPQRPWKYGAVAAKSQDQAMGDAKAYMSCVNQDPACQILAIN